jgi:hypothetical protein
VLRYFIVRTRYDWWEQCCCSLMTTSKKHDLASWKQEVRTRCFAESCPFDRCRSSSQVGWRRRCCCCCCCCFLALTDRDARCRQLFDDVHRSNRIRMKQPSTVDFYLPFLTLNNNVFLLIFAAVDKTSTHTHTHTHTTVSSYCQRTIVSSNVNTRVRVLSASANHRRTK